MHGLILFLFCVHTQLVSDALPLLFDANSLWICFSQGANATETRQVSTAIPLAEVPFVMRALGFYPTEQEVCFCM